MKCEAQAEGVLLCRTGICEDGRLRLGPLRGLRYRARGVRPRGVLKAPKRPNELMQGSVALLLELALVPTISNCDKRLYFRPFPQERCWPGPFEALYVRPPMAIPPDE